jgi:hypothetical protein
MMSRSTVSAAGYKPISSLFCNYSVYLSIGQKMAVLSHFLAVLLLAGRISA